MPALTPTRDRQYLAMAETYTEAASRLVGTAPLADIRLPLFMLIAHALELSFKAVLSRQGNKEEWLMMMGHGLERCRRNAQEEGFHPPSAAGTTGLVAALDQPHTFQAFRYPQSLGWSLPEPAETLRVLQAHIDDTRLFLTGGPPPATNA